MRSLLLGRPVVVVLVLMVSAGLAATALSVVGGRRADELDAQEAAALASTPPTLNAVGDPSAALGCSCGRVLLHVELPAGGDRVVVTRDDGAVVHDGPGGDIVDGWMGDGERVSYTAIAYGVEGVVSPAATATAETPDRTAPPVPGAPTGAGYPLEVTWAGGDAEAAYTLRRDGEEVGGGRAAPIADPDAADEAAPPPPTGLAAEPLAAGVRVRWQAVEDAGTSHDYAVRAADESGNVSDWSPSATIAVVSGVVSYRVNVDGGAAVEVAQPAVELAGLEPGSTHEVRVTAVDGAGNTSPASAPLSITIAQPQPAAPPEVDVVQAGGGISVEAGPGATVVGVEISPGDGQPYVPVDGTDADLPDGTYDVRVEVQDGSGATSTTTQEVVVDTTSPVVVASWSGTADGDGALTIDATDAVGIVSLELDGRPIKRVRRSRFSVDLGRPHVVVASDRGGHRTKVRIEPQKGKGKAKGTKRAGGTRGRG